MRLNQDILINEFKLKWKINEFAEIYYAYYEGPTLLVLLQYQLLLKKNLMITHFQVFESITSFLQYVMHKFVTISYKIIIRVQPVVLQRPAWNQRQRRSRVVREANWSSQHNLLPEGNI